MGRTQVETFQISAAAAEQYEESFVPAIFGEWAPLLADVATVGPGQRVLDVGCGTGVVAREAADRVGDRGEVVGLDLNESMLAVARRLRPDVDWRAGDAAALPFAEHSFDRVLCQSALMFLPDPALALREMRRVVADAGLVAVQVWATLDEQPAYGPLVEVAARHCGPDALSMLGAYWTMGDLERLGGLLDGAGLGLETVRTHTGTARFPSIEAWVRTEVDATPLTERITDEQYRLLLADAGAELGRLAASGGRAEVPIVGHLVTGRPR